MGNSVSCSTIGRINDIYRHRDRSSVVTKLRLTRKKSERRDITILNSISLAKTSYKSIKFENTTSDITKYEDTIEKKTVQGGLFDRYSKINNGCSEESEIDETSDNEEKKDNILRSGETLNTNSFLLMVKLLICECRRYIALKRKKEALRSSICRAIPNQKQITEKMEIKYLKPKIL